ERMVVRHWRLEYGQVDSVGRLIPGAPDDEIALLTLDVADQSTNVLSREVVEELDRLLGNIASRHLRGLIVRSTKPSGFVAGADVREFGKITDAAEAAELARLGQAVLDRLEALAFP